jgi:hypothetical protein
VPDGEDAGVGLVASAEGDGVGACGASIEVGVGSGERVAAGSGVAGVVVTGGAGGGGSDCVHALAVVTSTDAAMTAEARRIPFIWRLSILRFAEGGKCKTGASGGGAALECRRTVIHAEAWS